MPSNAPGFVEALGWLWGRIGVALGWLWGAYQLAINTLCGGFDVALGGLPRMSPGRSLPVSADYRHFVCYHLSRNFSNGKAAASSGLSNGRISSRPGRLALWANLTARAIKPKS